MSFFQILNRKIFYFKIKCHFLSLYIFNKTFFESAKKKHSLYSNKQSYLKYYESTLHLSLSEFFSIVNYASL